MSAGFEIHKKTKTQTLYINLNLFKLFGREDAVKHGEPCDILPSGNNFTQIVHLENMLYTNVLIPHVQYILNLLYGISSNKNACFLYLPFMLLFNLYMPLYPASYCVFSKQ